MDIKKNNKKILIIKQENILKSILSIQIGETFRYVSLLNLKEFLYYIQDNRDINTINKLYIRSVINKYIEVPAKVIEATCNECLFLQYYNDRYYCFIQQQYIDNSLYQRRQYMDMKSYLYKEELTALLQENCIYNLHKQNLNNTIVHKDIIDNKVDNEDLHYLFKEHLERNNKEL